MSRDQLYSVADLKGRGWTETAIKKFLPVEPDDTRPNPHYANAGAPMRFWLKRRVHRAEKTKTFHSWKNGAAQRRQAAHAAVATRIDNMVDAMQNATITIERGWTDDRIRDLAVRTHGGNYGGDPGPFSWTKRTARNCIRHRLTNYEELWAVCNRGETGREAYAVLRERVDALIDDAYPQYAEADAEPNVRPVEQPA